MATLLLNFSSVELLSFYSFRGAFQLLPLGSAHVIVFTMFFNAHVTSSHPQTKNYSKSLENLAPPSASYIAILPIANGKQESKGSVPNQKQCLGPLHYSILIIVAKYILRWELQGIQRLEKTFILT